jgi:hypothetical protein
MTNKTLALGVVVFLLAAGTAATTAEADGPAYGRSAAPAPLEGTWIVAVHPADCSTGLEIPGIPPFVSYLTFNRGGTMNEMTSNPFFEPGQRSPGFGVWERTGRTSYQYGWQAFIQFDGTSSPYQRGYQRVDQTLELLTNDAWDSYGSVNFYAGTPPVNVPPSGCAHATGARMY